MKRLWFVHDPVDNETAEELLLRYALRNIPTNKTLAADPRYWLVSAYLPYSEWVPRCDRTYQNRMWNR
ncbi:hypothetical protein BL250_05010 [Erwinia sp. OLTSP20]|nr:hypothetical protein BV501_06340 [Erwinia sp. OAMSP11]PIJ87466.1 hypothetical protein BLD46_00535 [Erwinia sp. OLMTSP26]PIJ93824.1 hypothetical protein BL250_05010 [Erwinia sp. OLTSP20]PIJ94238.1 hypothetical protein BL249_02875 [Erwinia sp. OLFS4]